MLVLGVRCSVTPGQVGRSPQDFFDVPLSASMNQDYTVKQKLGLHKRWRNSVGALGWSKENGVYRLPRKRTGRFELQRDLRELIGFGVLQPPFPESTFHRYYGEAAALRGTVADSPRKCLRWWLWPMPEEAVDWSVIYVSIVRSPKQVRTDDPVLERLLEEAEANLRWDYFYRDERIKIVPQGLWFMKKTLYRRMQIVASFLHALKTKRLREGKPVHCVPVSLVIELVLRPTKAVELDEVDDVLKPTAVPFSPEFKYKSVQKSMLRALSYRDVKHLRVLLKMHVRTPILKATRAVGEGPGEYDSDEDIVVGSDAWVDKQTTIDQADSLELFASKRSTIAHIEVVYVKPVDNSSD